MSEDSKEHDAKSELEAMSSVAKALNGLPDDAKTRVIEWVVDFMGLATSQPQSNAEEDGVEESNSEDGALFDDVAELFDLANPRTGAEKALVISYWMQEREHQESITSQSVNTVLKNLGHGIANITSAFSDLVGQKLALQVQKSGKSRQARKKYRITRKGVLEVEAMISREV